MFDQINGLPVHALVVHAAVVFVPLLVLGAIAYAVVPRWRPRVGWAVVLLAIAAPAAVFVGGGCTDKGVMEACWDALPPGGRLVANAVTTAGESVLARWHDARGGELVRIAISRSSPVGEFTALRPMMPVTQWVGTKGES